VSPGSGWTRSSWSALTRSAPLSRTSSTIPAASPNRPGPWPWRGSSAMSRRRASRARAWWPSRVAPISTSTGCGTSPSGRNWVSGARALLAVEIPERPGSFLEFCRTLGKRQITEFNYRYADERRAQVFVGVELGRGDEERRELIARLGSKGFGCSGYVRQRDRQAAYPLHGGGPCPRGQRRDAGALRVPRAPREPCSISSRDWAGGGISVSSITATTAPPMGGC
jgi:hypothetical protein